jgi:hypothetical protein
MADFALWATACETALWPAGRFSGVTANRLDALEGVIDADTVAAAIAALTVTREWNGPASRLLEALVG